jgi:hypothetical protein
MNIMHNANDEGKPTCELTLAEAPLINGLKLGMTSDEVLALFPGSREDAEIRSTLSGPPSKFGTSSFVITPNLYESKEKFSGMSQITLRLLAGRVSNFTVG